MGKERHNITQGTEFENIRDFSKGGDKNVSKLSQNFMKLGFKET
jgi:hypothetical protein